MKRSFARALAPIVAPLMVAGLLLGGPAVAVGSDSAETYVVVAEAGASAADVRRAISDAGGTVTERNAAIGTWTVTAPADGFILDVSASPAVLGAVSQRPIGRIPDAAPVKAADPEVEQVHEGDPGGPRHGGSTAEMDPLDDLLWGLAMVKSDLAREVNAGD